MHRPSILAPLAVVLLSLGCAGAPVAAGADGGADPGADAGLEVAAALDATDPGPDDDGGGPGAPDLPLPDAAPDAANADAAESDVAPDVPDAPCKGFCARGSRLVDAGGRTLVLHGVNVANSAKYAADLLPWEGPGDFADLAAAGFDSVRLLTFWAAVMPTEGVVDAAYLDAYAQRVQWAAEAGLLVVVDMHQDLFGVGFHEDGAPLWACDAANYASYEPGPTWYLNYAKPEVKACFDAFYADDALFGRFRDAWLAVATRFADHPAVVGFDLLNEPNPGSLAPEAFVTDTWQPRLAQLSDAIAAVAPDRVVFWQGATMLAVGLADPFAPAGRPRVAYAPHYYHPLVHDGGAYDPDSMLGQLEYALAAADASVASLGGVPVWMGELGGPSTAAGFDRYLEDLLSRLAARAWGFAVWSDDPSDSFGIREPSGAFKADMVARLAHPYARRVPGPIVSQAIDFATGRFEARFVHALDLPLVAWTGPGGTARVETADGVAAGACEALPGGADGAWSCSLPSPPKGTELRVALARGLQ